MYIHDIQLLNLDKDNHTDILISKDTLPDHNVIVSVSQSVNTKIINHNTIFYTHGCVGWLRVLSLLRLELLLVLRKS